MENVHEAPRWNDETVAKLVAQLESKLDGGGVFLGALLADPVDAELLRLEPTDIHMTLRL